MTPDTAVQWALLAAKAAFEVLDRIQDDELKREAAAETRKMLSDHKMLLRADAQEMLDRRKREG